VKSYFRVVALVLICFLSVFEFIFMPYHFSAKIFRDCSGVFLAAQARGLCDVEL
jgi:hypothetical protein